MFTAPVTHPFGLSSPLVPYYANPRHGHSAIVETSARRRGQGPPPRGALVARAVAEALPSPRRCAISAGEHPHFRVPSLDDRGTPVGIDVRAVVETGITPLINTGIAGRKAGTGQVGAGVVRAPLACFTQALEALANS